jgi:hypothetical protein
MSDSSKISRRYLLSTAATTGLGLVFMRNGAAAGTKSNSDWLASVTAYLNSLSRPDGGYGWEDQQISHLTPTFAVIGCHRILGITPPNRRRLAEFIRSHHPTALKKLEQPQRIFDYQQIQSLIWLGEDVADFRKQVEEWREPLRYMKRYERHGYPVFQSESTVILCRDRLGIPVQETPSSFVAYLEERRRPDGSFNNTPTSDGGGGHVMNTWWGLRALKVLGRTNELRKKTIDWLRSCQLPNGGFTYQPEPQFAGVDDAAYTWAALRSLHELGAAPKDPLACLQYLFSLRKQDGGFSDRNDWNSNPLATYYALDSLRVLEMLDRPAPVQKPPVRQQEKLPPDLKVFSIQLQAIGRGSPVEAVDLANSLKIHLWGAKNAREGWIEAAQTVADRRGVPVTFFAANEEYGTWVEILGMGTYSHMSDVIAPQGSDPGSSLAGKTAYSWRQFQTLRLDPLQRGRGRLIWQFGENEELVRMLLDDSLERDGYAAISTFHFGNPDFTNSEPFLNRYRGQIPFIALQDAHGHEAWWLADMLTGFRTVFLAREPSWEGWLEALSRNWVAAIRHDAVSRFETWMHGSGDEVDPFILDHSLDWQWWKNPEVKRPMVSIVPVQPDDRFEVARPEIGVTLRVRCAWENTAHGRPKTPITELVALNLDGKRIHPEPVELQPTSWRDPGDNYHHYHLAKPSSGLHKVTAVVRRVGDDKRLERTIEFRV